MTVTLTNIGDGDLTFTSALLTTGTNYSIDSIPADHCPTGPGTLLPQVSCKYYIVFSPVRRWWPAPDTRTDILTIITDAPGTPKP